MISFDRDQWRVRSEAHFMIMRPALNAIRVFGIVALTTVPSGLFAQTYLSDATICRRAINSDRSGWVEGSDYTQEASRRGLTFRACDEMNNQPGSHSPAKDQTSDEHHPSFLQAGIFFFTGLEPPDIKFLAPNSALYERHQIFYKQAYTTVPISYQLQADKPCTIFGYILAPPYGSMRLEFDKLPSPRAATYTYVRGPNGTDLVVSMRIPHETFCTAQTKPIRDNEGKPAVERIPGTVMCNDRFEFYFNASRRIKALDYIRSNFCAGQPEPPPPPPPPPPKPY